jgi:hypothetical protein
MPMQPRQSALTRSGPSLRVGRVHRRLIDHMGEHNVDCVEPTEEAERKWVSHHSRIFDISFKKIGRPA